jgi:hypothetical protein
MFASTCGREKNIVLRTTIASHSQDILKFQETQRFYLFSQIKTQFPKRNTKDTALG